MDGAHTITQGAIPPVGGKMVYQFRAFPAGTRWYHTHIGPKSAPCEKKAGVPSLSRVVAARVFWRRAPKSERDFPRRARVACVRAPLPFGETFFLFFFYFF